MSGEFLQTLAVALIVAAAAAFLVWRRMRRRARPSALCGDCPGCATGPRPPGDDALVRIGDPPAGLR